MQQGRGYGRDALILAAATIGLRVLCIWLLPEKAYSVDLRHWTVIIDRLQHGNNPYVSTTYLNWPPLWMQVLYVLGEVSRITGIAAVNVIRGFLIAIDTVNILLLQFLAVRFLGIAQPRTLLLAGFAANPVALILTCQHGNFDAIVVTALLCFTIALLRWRESSDPVDWLFASLALGIGILAKTFPLALTPLLAYHASKLSVRARLLGAMLVVVPAAIGMSVLFVLSPHAVIENVLRYRSFGGYFGISGILGVAGLDAIAPVYAAIFPLVLAAALLFLARRLTRARDIAARHVILLAATILLALITFGTGYGPQYNAWPLPFLLLSTALFGAEWRRDLIVIWIVATITFVVEYAVSFALGAFLLHLTRDASVWRAAYLLTDRRLVTLLRLPLFAAFVWLVVRGWGVATRDQRS